MISIIVPIYKVEDCLHLCVDSILAQTFSDFELILIDDGSPDNCGAICDEYAEKDSRVRVIHQENGGLSAARNTGIEIAKGEYLTFIDSDDCIQNSFLEVLYNLIRKYSAQISSCQRSDFTEHMPLLDPGAPVTEKTYTGHDAVLEMYTERPFVRVTAWGKLYDAKLFSNVRYPVGKIHEDQATTPIVLSKADRVAATNQRLYCYRVREGSITHSGFKLRNYDDLEAVKGCIDYFSSHNQPALASAADKRMRELTALYSIQARMAGIYDQVPGEYRMSCRSAYRWLQKNLSDDKYTFYLKDIHPNWLRPHAYLRKLKKTLHIPCN